MPKNSFLRTALYAWLCIASFFILIVLIDAGTKAFFSFELVNFLAFKNGVFAKVIYATASIFGLFGLIGFIISQAKAVSRL